MKRAGAGVGGSFSSLVTLLDLLHDSSHPADAAVHVFSTLKPDGTRTIVEPFACDRSEQNYNTAGRNYSCASTMICTQAGEERIRNMLTAAGFTRFPRAVQTKFNPVFEARL